MKLVTDAKVVAELARKRQDENWKFRSFLKGIDLEAREVDAIVHRHYEEVSNQIDCCACGNCCRQLQPVLQGDDVTRLAAGLEIPREELVERFLTTDEDGDTIFNAMPCPLLSGDRCRAYEHRPDVCRSFPHLHKDEFVFRLIRVVQNCSVCPIVFNVFERLKDELWHDPDDACEEDWA